MALAWAWMVDSRLAWPTALAAAARALSKGEEGGSLLVDCKHQTMTPAAWDALRKATQDSSMLTKSLAEACVFRNPIPGLPPPHPQAMVLRVRQSSIDSLWGQSATCRGATSWFEAWDIAV